MVYRYSLLPDSAQKTGMASFTTELPVKKRDEVVLGGERFTVGRVTAAGHISLNPVPERATHRVLTSTHYTAPGLPEAQLNTLCNELLLLDDASFCLRVFELTFQRDQVLKGQVTAWNQHALADRLFTIRQRVDAEVKTAVDVNTVAALLAPYGFRILLQSLATQWGRLLTPEEAALLQAHNTRMTQRLAALKKGDRP
jgi:hypothetical protein